MDYKQALGYLYQVTIIEPTVADDAAEAAIAIIRAYIDELEMLLQLIKEDRTKTISLRINPNLDRELRIEAAKRDLNRSDFIRQALAEKLSEIERQQQSQPQGSDDDE